ncbi:unannotated protein [freshwater metagenome]|uniref:Unannotated protein n=1 Tax=freshwater metagenome TaxID=449393 RepID=A0A6J5YLM0_9ZZZZ
MFAEENRSAFTAPRSAGSVVVQSSTHESERSPYTSGRQGFSLAEYATVTPAGRGPTPRNGVANWLLRGTVDWPLLTPVSPTNEMMS